MGHILSDGWRCEHFWLKNQFSFAIVVLKPRTLQLLQVFPGLINSPGTPSSPPFLQSWPSNFFFFFKFKDTFTEGLFWTYIVLDEEGRCRRQRRDSVHTLTPSTPGLRLAAGTGEDNSEKWSEWVSAPQDREGTQQNQDE